MTDLEKFRALFQEVGIPFREASGVFEVMTAVILESDYGPRPKVYGHMGFRATFYFDEQGKFDSVEIAE